MTEKKRKSTVQESERSSKKAATESVRVRYLNGSSIAKPVVASSPGVTLPKNLKFQSFGLKSRPGTSELLLHSSEHPTIDYNATETITSNATEKHLKHYIALFDPSSKNVRITEAKKMVVRSCVRRREAAEESDDEQTNAPVSNYSSRAALTQEFGTKKSKRAVQSIAQNRLLTRAGDDESDPLSKAILSTLTDDEDEPTGQTDSARSNKPLPAANMSTEDIDQVYPLENLVFPGPALQTLALMPVSYWRDRITARKDVTATSRFVAARVSYLTKALLASPADEKLLQNLQILRYILLLLEIHSYVSRLPARRPIPFPDAWPAKTTSDNLNFALKKKLLQHFFPTNLPNRPSLTLLRTTVLALTLHTPPPSLNAGPGILITEPTDISLDLALDRTEINKLYRELGCKLDSPREAELERWGMQKMMNKGVPSAARPKFAKLNFPIVFPTVSRGPAGRGRR